MTSRIVLLVLLASGTLACGSLALASGDRTPGPSATGAVVRITRVADHDTVSARVGDQLQISLGDEYDWRLDPPDGVVITAPVQNKMLVRGTQAIWLASAAGTTTITGWGTLPCPSGQVCAMIAVPFSTTVVVSR